jgi:Ser/Thr protein kinase RdoA (MazF antagonist)
VTLAPSDVRGAIERRVAASLGLTVRAWSRVSGGTQNRLFQLRTHEGPLLLAKLYAVDRWPRLETEYATLHALNERDLAGVPRALLRDDDRSYAVYSFEPGEIRSASQLTRANVEAIAAFLVSLHRFGPDDLSSTTLVPAVDAMVSPAAYRRMIYGRLAAASQRLPQGVPSEVDRLLDQLSDVEELPRHLWRLTSGDFGPQNMLFTADGTLTVCDFESAGWDDPAHAVMGFVAHASTEELPPERATAFLGAFASLARLSPAEQARYERVGRILDVEWVAVYTSALSPDAIANKRSAVADFNADTHIANALARIEQRLARATAGRGYPFPS